VDYRSPRRWHSARRSLLRRSISCITLSVAFEYFEYSTVDIRDDVTCHVSIVGDGTGGLGFAEAEI